MLQDITVLELAASGLLRTKQSDVTLGVQRDPESVRGRLGRAGLAAKEGGEKRKTSESKRNNVGLRGASALPFIALRFHFREK